MEWKISAEPVFYEEAVAFMEARVAAIIAGEAEEMAWLLEHPPLYTAGTSAKNEDLRDTLGLPVYMTGRGGQYTYHGPGQRVAYVMLDLRKRGADVRAFVKKLEQWIILTLAGLGVTGEVREGRIGVWVKTGNSEAKVAALGIRLRQWVTYHGISLNVNPDLGHYRGIVPCGIEEYGVTSLVALNVNVSMDEVDKQLMESFGHVFAH